MTGGRHNAVWAARDNQGRNPAAIYLSWIFYATLFSGMNK
jgi:hypothetical protein